MIPKLSYTIWFSQRTGSSLLCKALEATGIAGIPGEWLYKRDLYQDYDRSSPAELQEHLWEIGSTSNGVLAIKHSFHEPFFSQLLEILKEFPTCPAGVGNRVAIWENTFPHHRHIFMTRRNKVRLAVSWWKAIQSQQWHRLPGEKPKPVDLTTSYSFEAIKHLYLECSMREAGIQEFFAEGNIIPFTIAYEDFVNQYEETIRATLDYLGLSQEAIAIPPPPLAPTADEVSEAWVQRFRRELQANWTNRGW